MEPDVRTRAVGYWSLAIVLAVLGFIDLIAIGAPFFAVGMGMLIFGRWRHDRAVFIPGMASTIVFVASFLLVAPSCTRVSGVEALTVCRNALGFTVQGDVSLWVGFVIAAMCAVGTWFLARWIARRRSHRREPSFT